MNVIHLHWIGMVASSRHGYLNPHRFLSFPLASEQVSKESLNFLYGRNNFAFKWGFPFDDNSYNDCSSENEPVMNAFLHIIVAKNRDRICQEECVIRWGISDCEIVMISQVSIRFTLLA